MWRMDQWWKSLYREVPWVTDPPSVYVRRHFRFTTQPADAPLGSNELRHAYGQLGGAPMLLHASDWPHRYGASGDEVLASFRRRIARPSPAGNAVEWYGLRAREVVGSVR